MSFEPQILRAPPDIAPPIPRCQLCGGLDGIAMASCGACDRWWAACGECSGGDYTRRALRGHTAHAHVGNPLRATVSGVIPYRGRK